jgi:hypothetical protein
MPRITGLKFNPDPVPLNATEFEFSFTDHNGKKRSYKIKIKGNDKKALASAVFALLRAREKRWIDWPTLKRLNVDWGSDAVQEEMALKVARRHSAMIMY